MTESHNPVETSESEERLERDLHDALRSERLGSDALARIRAAVHREWQRLYPARRPARSRRMLWAALAASLGILALGLAWVLHPPTPAPIAFGVVSLIDQSRAHIKSRNPPVRPVRVGDLLYCGDELATRGPGRISLSSGDNLRVNADTELRFLGPGEVELLRGMIYIDHPPAAARSSQLRIRTRAGTVEHVGTAFEVFSNERIVRVRVREGEVRLRNSSGDILARAGTELIAGPDGHLTRGAVPLNGDPWHWVFALAPNYEIEGRSLLDFLEFESRELGYRLVFADQHARDVAERTILHGTVHGRAPLEAVNSVLATTSLTYAIHDNTLQVQSGST
jgi:FecR protein